VPPFQGPTDQELLSVVDVSVHYGHIRALEPLSFSLRQGGLVLVLGPNGAGKTSLVKALAGAVPAHSGSVRLGGKDVTWLPAHSRVKQGICLIPEGRGTLPGLTVRDNLDLGRHAAGRARQSDSQSDLEMVLELFPPLASRLEQDCSTLSGGEMQMLAVARGLLSKPRVLLLDEPSLGLAPIPTARVYDVLDQLNSNGLAMILVEQKAVPLDRIPDTTLVLQSGRVVYRALGQRPTEAQLAELYLGGVGAAQ
jgi:branched-chain amino acid transport system ATP-binding protein